jgi:hypothetical protein
MFASDLLSEKNNSNVQIVSRPIQATQLIDISLAHQSNRVPNVLIVIMFIFQTILKYLLK